VAAQTFDSVYRALKRGEIQPVYLLSGPESSLKDELVRAVADAVLAPEARDFNLDVRAASDLDGEAFNALVETPPMLAERRLVVVKGLEEWRSNAKVWQVVKRYLERPSPWTVLVLTVAGEESPDAALKGAVQVELTALPPERLRRWVSMRAERAGLNLTPDGVEHLVDAVGNDLAALSAEIDKLAAAAADGEVTDADRVGDLVGVRRGETVHHWVDSVLQRETSRALELIDCVLPQAGITGVRMVSALGTGLVVLRLARAMWDAGSSRREVEEALYRDIASTRPPELRGRSWREISTRWAQSAQAWTAAEITRALRSALAADRALKTSALSDERGTLSGLVLELAQRRAA